MYFQMADFPGLQPWLEGELVVLGLRLAVECVAIEVDLLVLEFATRHGRQPPGPARAALCQAHA